MPELPTTVDPTARPHSLYEGIEYDRFWQSSPRRNLDRLEHALVRKLLPRSGSRMIDVGCGYGRLADCYLERFQQVIMADGSMSLLRQALARTGGAATCVACDVTRLPFQTAAFDTVLMIRVFHHIPDSRACLAGLQRVLCGDGRLVFSFCNKRNAARILRWLIGARAQSPFTMEPEGVGSTLISHHPYAVRQMLHDSGFTAVKYYGAGVVDWLAGKMGPAGRRLPPGEHLARLLGSSAVAPWLLCQAGVRGNAGLSGSSEIGDLLRCPCCGGSLSGEAQGFGCPGCRRHYPIVDGIIDLRVD